MLSQPYSNDMKTINTPLFWALSALFLYHQFSQKVLGWSFPLFDHYLDTFLLAPLLLSGLLAEWRDLYRLGPSYIFPLHLVALMCLVLLVISELLFPALSRSFTADLYDGVSIFLGSCFFYLFMNRPLRLSDPARSSAL